MPNWADTRYVITGGKEELNTLNDIITGLEQMPQPYVQNGFGKLWLGCLVSILGGDWKEIYCRGEITGHELWEDKLIIDTMTAWDEMKETRNFLQDKFPTLNFLFVTEEPGMCIYKTNDRSGKVFPNKWHFYYSDDEDGTLTDDFFKEIETIIAQLKENGVDVGDVKPNETSLRKFLKAKEEKNPDGFWWSLDKVTIVEA